MSSEYDLLASLLLVKNNLYKFGGPILIAIGTVSSILSLIVFLRKNLRKNPCSIYFVAINVSNLIQIYISVLLTTLSTGYEIDPGSQNLVLCRFYFYVVLVITVLNPCYTILASIDRILLTSRNALTRQRSTVRLAYISIIIVTLFWMLFHIHALVLTNLIELAPGYVICYFQPGIQVNLVSYYSVIITGIVIPLLMIISGLWAVKNVRSLGRVAPVSQITAGETIVSRNVHASHSKDRQLLRILLMDISVYVIFNLMTLACLINQQFFESSSTSPVRTQINTILLGIGAFGSYISSCIGCYVNLLVSKTFREEVRNILMCK